MKKKSLLYLFLSALFVSLLTGVGQVSAAGKSILDIVTIEEPSVIGVGDSEEFSVVIDDWSVEGVGSMNFTPVSSNPSVARVESLSPTFAIIHGEKPGTAVLTVNIGGGYEPYKVEVEVVASEDESGMDNEDTYKENVLSPESLRKMEDLEAYMKKVELLVTYEENASELFNQNRYVNSSNRKKAFLTFQNYVIPNYTKLVNGMNKITPPNDELKQIHAKIKYGSQMQLEGIKLIKDAVSTKKINDAKFSAGNKKIMEGQQYIETANRMVDQYVDKYSK
ncbi:hypothetical protein ACE6ED_15295 [Paenibacillus sp. CN-4]|uniref:hypothetical protein n=1 Tax=Paenibacillus nanchangensis TaxID=3348343 RepID=UPI003979A2BD